MQKNLVALSLTALLLISWGYFVYASFDRAATAKGADQLRYENEQRLKILTKVCDRAVRGRSEQEARDLLTRVAPEDELYVKDGALHATWLAIALDKHGQALRCVY